jgi:hypothetical protein
MQPWSQPLLWKGAVVISGEWNPADKTSDITLSSGNSIATKGGVASNHGVRSTTSHNSGKIYVEFPTGGRFAGSNTGVGIATISANLTTIGASAVGGLLVFSSGGAYFNGSALTNVGNLTGGNIIVSLAIDFTNQKGWFRENGGNWNNDVIANQNPATNTGGFSIAALFPSNAAYCVFCSNDSGTSGSSTGLSTTSFAYAIPAGFTAWG